MIKLARAKKPLQSITGERSRKGVQSFRRAGRACDHAPSWSDFVKRPEQRVGVFPTNSPFLSQWRSSMLLTISLVNRLDQLFAASRR